MVSFKTRQPVARADGQQKYYVVCECLSSDTKPTADITNGSQLLEMDTSTLYFFDEDGGEWLPWE